MTVIIATIHFAVKLCSPIQMLTFFIAWTHMIWFSSQKLFYFTISSYDEVCKKFFNISANRNILSYNRTFWWREDILAFSIFLVDLCPGVTHQKQLIVLCFVCLYVGIKMCFIFTYLLHSFIEWMSQDYVIMGLTKCSVSLCLHLLIYYVSSCKGEYCASVRVWFRQIRIC